MKKHHLKGVVKIEPPGEADTFGPVDEVTPFSETQTSPDGTYRRCKYPNGTRHCFFAPPPGS
jgi:hypothetical protein